MRSAFALALLITFALPAAAQRADLAQARTLYNERQFDAAIDAAITAQKVPATADLGTVRVVNLDPRDNVDFLMALGEALFFEDEYGAAALLFESGIDAAVVQGPATAEAMLEWWGSAMERHADALEREPRLAAFTRLRERMSRELARNPGSAAAAYWIAVGTRGVGHAVEAWEAAVAGWVRARLAGPYSAKLRADLDKLVLEGIIPDRVRLVAPDRRAQVESDLKGEWAVVKERWK